MNKNKVIITKVLTYLKKSKTNFYVYENYGLFQFLITNKSAFLQNKKKVVYYNFIFNVIESIQKLQDGDY